MPSYHNPERDGRPGSFRIAAVGLAVGALVAALVTTSQASATAPRLSAAKDSRQAVVVDNAATGSDNPASAARPIGHDTVVLVTGDRVNVTRWSDGRSSATLAPGSPSAGRPVKTMTTATQTFVMPRLCAGDGRHLDSSLFDVNRLAALQSNGRPTPLVVRFHAGTAAHSLSGIHVEVAGATKTAAGTTLAKASYTGDATGLSGSGGSWRGVDAISLPRQPRTRSKGYVLHTLTINVLGQTGKPVRFAEAWVQNVEDSRLFTAPVPIVNGVGKVSVPEGPYSLIVGTFTWTVVNPDVGVSADKSVNLDARDATVHPTVSVRGVVPLEFDLTLLRTSEKIGSFSYGLSGSRRLRLSPVPAHLRHGAFHTELGATLVPRSVLHGGDVNTARIVFTKDERLGIPATIRIVHQTSDFAVVPHRYFSNGPARPSALYVFGFTKYDNFAFILGLPITLGSARTVWLQGGRQRTWLQGIDAFFKFSTFEFAEMDAPLRPYPPGQANVLQFLRGPVGPGTERGMNADDTGARCWLCRDGRLLHGGMPLMSSARTQMFGIVSQSSVASWKLSAGRRTLQGGTFGIFPYTVLPAARRSYTLTATSHPDVGKWRLSTKVSDSWRFTSAAGRRVVPLLMASYVPTNDLAGARPAGKTGFRLDFDNLGPQAARVTKATVRFSVLDRGGWRPAELTRLDSNSFRVSYTAPFRPGRPYVSLSVQATDARGRTVTETAVHAYRSTRPTKATRSHALKGTRSSASAASAAAARPGTSAVGYPGHARGAIPACTPTKAREYRCFALIENRGPEALTKSGDPKGYNAIDLRDAYGLDSLPNSGDTVAVVVAFDYPSAEADMNRYRRQFGLPTCTTASGCFKKINQDGRVGNYPQPDYGWALEAALDLQMVSTSCPTCHIILSEADAPVTEFLNNATDAAVAAGAKVTNHSYGIQEYTGIRRSNRHYNAAGVTAVTSTGDSGYQPAQFPASSPDVISVGGTVLNHASNVRGWTEHAWLYGGSGCSAYFAKPDFQTDPACGMRTSADLSAVADSVAVYDTYLPPRYAGWLTVAGTSISSPLVAGMVAAAGAGGVKPGTLYSRVPAFHDITKGLNGFCRNSYICTAKPGYDAPTGLGTPRGLAPFQ